MKHSQKLLNKKSLIHKNGKKTLKHSRKVSIIVNKIIYKNTKKIKNKKGGMMTPTPGMSPASGWSSYAPQTSTPSFGKKSGESTWLSSTPNQFRKEAEQPLSFELKVSNTGPKFRLGHLPQYGSYQGIPSSLYGKMRDLTISNKETFKKQFLGNSASVCVMRPLTKLTCALKITLPNNKEYVPNLGNGKFSASIPEGIGISQRVCDEMNAVGVKLSKSTAIVTASLLNGKNGGDSSDAELIKKCLQTCPIMLEIAVDVNDDKVIPETTHIDEIRNPSNSSLRAICESLRPHVVHLSPNTRFKMRLVDMIKTENNGDGEAPMVTLCIGPVVNFHNTYNFFDPIAILATLIGCVIRYDIDEVTAQEFEGASQPAPKVMAKRVKNYSNLVYACKTFLTHQGRYLGLIECSEVLQARNTINRIVQLECNNSPDTCQLVKIKKNKQPIKPVSKYCVCKINLDENGFQECFKLELTKDLMTTSVGRGQFKECLKGFCKKITVDYDADKEIQKRIDEICGVSNTSLPLILTEEQLQFGHRIGLSMVGPNDKSYECCLLPLANKTHDNAARNGMVGYSANFTEFNDVDCTTIMALSFKQGTNVFYQIGFGDPVPFSKSGFKPLHHTNCDMTINMVYTGAEQVQSEEFKDGITDGFSTKNVLSIAPIDCGHTKQVVNALSYPFYKTPMSSLCDSTVRLTWFDEENCKFEVQWVYDPTIGPVNIVNATNGWDSFGIPVFNKVANIIEYVNFSNPHTLHAFKTKLGNEYLLSTKLTDFFKNSKFKTATDYNDAIKKFNWNEEDYDTYLLYRNKEFEDEVEFDKSQLVSYNDIASAENRSSMNKASAENRSLMSGSTPTISVPQFDPFNLTQKQLSRVEFINGGGKVSDLPEHNLPETQEERLFLIKRMREIMEGKTPETVSNHPQSFQSSEPPVSSKDLKEKSSFPELSSEAVSNSQPFPVKKSQHGLSIEEFIDCVKKNDVTFYKREKPGINTRVKAVFEYLQDILKNKGDAELIKEIKTQIDKSSANSEGYERITLGEILHYHENVVDPIIDIEGSNNNVNGPGPKRKREPNNIGSKKSKDLRNQYNNGSSQKRGINNRSNMLSRKR
jgi:hypothetical protein